MPGLLFALAFGLYVYFKSRASNADRGEALTLARFMAATREAFWALGMPVVILGGIYSGIFSPTEAAGVAAVYAIVVSMFIYKEIDLPGLFEAAAQAAYLTAQLMLIIAAAGVFSWLLTISGAGPAMTSFFKSLEWQPWMILLAINIFLLLAGCLLDTASAILLFTPVLLPIAIAAGVDPVHFGIVMTTNLSIGMFTPPFGVNIFVVQAVFNQHVKDIYAGVWPFIVLSIGVLGLITYIPQLSLFLTHYIR